MIIFLNSFKIKTRDDLENSRKLRAAKLRQMILADRKQMHYRYEKLLKLQLSVFEEKKLRVVKNVLLKLLQCNCRESRGLTRELVTLSDCEEDAS